MDKALRIIKEAYSAKFEGITIADFIADIDDCVEIVEVQLRNTFVTIILDNGCMFKFTKRPSPYYEPLPVDEPIFSERFEYVDKLKICTMNNLVHLDNGSCRILKTHLVVCDIEKYKDKVQYVQYIMEYLGKRRKWNSIEPQAIDDFQYSDAYRCMRRECDPETIMSFTEQAFRDDRIYISDKYLKWFGTLKLWFVLAILLCDKKINKLTIAVKNPSATFINRVLRWGNVKKLIVKHPIMGSEKIVVPLNTRVKYFQAWLTSCTEDAFRTFSQIDGIKDYEQTIKGAA